MLKRLSSVLLLGSFLALAPVAAGATPATGPSGTSQPGYGIQHHDGYGDGYGGGSDSHYQCYYRCDGRYGRRYDRGYDRRYRPRYCWYHDRYGWYRARCRGYGYGY